MRLVVARFFIVLLAACACLPAQQYVFRPYRQVEGLKNLAVRSIASDCQGFLWIGTEAGVFRFLGSSFVKYGTEQGIHELGIQEMATDAACNVWAGTSQNLYRFNGRQFVPALSQPVHLDVTHGLAVEDASRLLVVDNGRLFRLEHDPQGKMLSYRQLHPSSVSDAANVTSVSIVRDAARGMRIWAGAGTGLMSCTDPSQPQGASGSSAPLACTRWNSGNGLPADHWESVVVDAAGTVWAQGWTHIVALPSGASQFLNRSVPVSAQGNLFVRARLAVDPQGAVLAPVDDGIVRWQQNHWQPINSRNGIPRNVQITSTIFDSNGDLWLGSYGDGLYNWSGYRVWEGWNDERQLPSRIVWAVDAKRSARILAGTDQGPAWIDPRSGASGPLVHGRWTPGLIVAMGPEHDGSEWLATNSGRVLRLDPGTGRTSQIAFVPGFIQSALQDQRGALYLGTLHGLFVRDPDGSAAHRIAAADALLGADIRVNAGCQSPDGTLWFLTPNRLLRNRAGQWSAPPIANLPGTGQGRLLALSCARDGSLWAVGVRIGAWHITQQQQGLRAEPLQAPEAIRSDDAYAILADHRGWIWMGTGNGLLAWNGTDWRHLTQESGLLWNDVDEWGLHEGSDGSIWISTSGGLAHLVHPEQVFTRVHLPILLTAVDRGNQELSPASHISFPWSPLPIFVQMASPLARNRSELTFEYQLEGLNSGWIASHDGVAVLSGLSPGHYKLVARAVNPGLDAVSAPLSLNFAIAPPWWRNLWFLFSATVALVFLLVMASRTYARHLRARSVQLEALVRERTRELEASREQLRLQATHDSLTGMLNREAILRELSTALDSACVEMKTLVVALVDVDHFKSINDRCGHLGGDEALRRVAAALREAIRSTDRIGRYGGEEFLLVLAEIPLQSLEGRLAALHASMTNLQLRLGDIELTITCSLGATSFDPASGAADLERLLSTADQALYAAKAAGRNCFALRSAQENPAPLDVLR
jgi:diguanylate cyclase (GGDEF)-like protein